MTLAIMQPYLFPYPEYFRLLARADRFLVLDDVQFIQQGWINRNALPGPLRFTVPVHRAHHTDRICDVTIVRRRPWVRKWLAMLEQQYHAAPGFARHWPGLRQVIENPTDSLADYLLHALRWTAAALAISTEIIPTTRRYGNAHLTGAARVRDLCRREHATTYLNLSGGRALYAEAEFAAAGVHLEFLPAAAGPHFSILHYLLTDAPLSFA
jgi:hypothetical protein